MLKENRQKSLVPIMAFKKGCIPWNKGLKDIYSEETLRKMRDKKIGRRLSKETRKKMSLAQMGRVGAMLGKNHSEIAKIKIGEKSLGEQNGNWKGDKVGYDGLHSWVKYHLGRPKVCEFCKDEIDNPCRIHWANKSGNYLRDLTDWLRLCAKCHVAYDRGKITI